MIYLVSNTNDCWKVNEGSNTKSMYRSNSCIESCESGVVGDIEDNRESNMWSQVMWSKLIENQTWSKLIENQTCEVKSCDQN